MKYEEFLSMDLPAHSVIKIVQDSCAGRLKFATYTQEKIHRETGLVAQSHVLRVLMSRRSVMRNIVGGDDKKAALKKAKKYLKQYVKYGAIERHKIGNIVCIGVSK